MPITYQIERTGPGRGIVRTTCSGVVTFSQVMEHFEVLRADPERPDTLDVLLDLCGVETLPDRGQVRAVAEKMGQLPPRVGWGSLAVVAHRDVVFGVSRMFQTLSQGVFESTHVFRSIEDAETWLSANRLTDRRGSSEG